MRFPNFISLFKLATKPEAPVQVISFPIVVFKITLSPTSLTVTFFIPLYLALPSFSPLYLEASSDIKTPSAISIVVLLGLEPLPSKLTFEVLSA